MKTPDSGLYARPRVDEAILIELDPPRTAPLRPAASRWTALLIAAFTALTCAGLGVSTVAPRAAGSRPDSAAPTADRTARAEQYGEPSPERRAGPRLEQAAGAVPVAATARAVPLAAGGWDVHVAGEAAVTVGSVEVALSVAGRPVADATGVVGPEATLTTVIGRDGAGAAPWSVDVAVAAASLAWIPDAVGTVEIRWPRSPAGPAGSAVVVVSLGDGRGRGA